MKPGREEWRWLLYKTFGVNLAARAAFLVAACADGELAPARAWAAGAWWQAQDAVFTLYGRAWLGLLAASAGAVRVAGRPVGDLALSYAQLCAAEWLNRLILGAVGGNPSVLGVEGTALVGLNVLQGMAAGGPLVPAISRLKARGLLSVDAAARLYQLSGLAMHLGLLATFGHQRLHAALTAALAVAAWGAWLLADRAPELDDRELGQHDRG